MSQTGLEDLFVIQNQKKLRCGYTTGSCAAAASKAGVTMLLLGIAQEEAAIQTPRGICLHLAVEEIRMEKSGGEVCQVTCAVRKDGGDDIDATHGALIFSTVSWIDEGEGHESGGGTDGSPGSPLSTDASCERVRIDGGTGVGRVTKPGLDQPIGEAAINTTPRRMIRESVEEVLDAYGCRRRVSVVISVPRGEEIAGRTFNPRLGIVGGISILGTSGIVMPMSETALLDSMRAEMRMLAANGGSYLVITPGNYGEAFSRELPGLDLTYEMKCSNFVGQTIDMAIELGIRGILFISHIGKFIKLSGGIMNTHSHEADCRAELMAAAALRAGADPGTVRLLLETGTSEDALSILAEREPGRMEAVMKQVTDRVSFYLNQRGRGSIELGAILFSSVRGKLGETEEVADLLEKIENQRRTSSNEER